MRHDRLTDRWPAPVHNVQYAGRKARFDTQVTQQGCGARGNFRGLGDDRIASGQRRRNLPGKQVQRQVPRADAADHAQTLTQGVVDRTAARRAGLHGVRFAAPGCDGGGEVAQVAHGAWNVELARQAQWLACVARFECREFVNSCFDQICQVLQRLGALPHGRIGPLRSGATGGCHSGFHIIGVGVRALGERGAASWLRHVQPRAVAWRAQLAINQVGEAA